MPKPPRDRTVISLSIDRDLLKEVDEFVEKGVFSSRSELVREALRWFLDELRKGNIPLKRREVG